MTSQINSDLLLRRAREAGLTDSRELAVFMAQMQVESAGFSRLSENLNYSGKRLLQVFGGRNGIGTLEEAEALASRGPEAVANAMYGGEWGKRLGNTEPGDGWRFRGRGFVQITGRANYEHFGRALGIDLVTNPDLAATPEVGAAIAVQYWRDRVVRFDAQFDVKRATKLINGGRQGLLEREGAAFAWEQRLREQPSGRVASTQPPAEGRIRQVDISAERLQPGASGPAVRFLQESLDRLGYLDERGHRLRADGEFGAHTEAAVRAFQADHGLPSVGRVGPRTLAALNRLLQPPTPLDPAHADYALQQHVSHAVDAMERSLGRTPDDNSDRLKASLLLAAKQQGLSRVDHVVLSGTCGAVQAGQHVFAVQGHLDDPASRRVHVATQQALATPVQASWARLAEVLVREHTQPSASLAPAFTAQHGEHGDGMRRSPSP